ncbi:unnamed protein product [Rotaria socialis]|uniref:Uncharacterized protein n=1 Tax=Rotaria socialis TaxID=392032 RepID=A0A818K653_9BILA|nr:unnamed protein product [Rotaria socialis]
MLAYPQSLRGNISLSSTTIDSVVKFYYEDGISRASSNSKDTIKINGKPAIVRFLEMTILDAYRIFNERFPGVVSRSTFTVVRPHEVKIATPHETCMCIIHENMDLLIKMIGSVDSLLTEIKERWSTFLLHAYSNREQREYIKDLRSQSTDKSFIVAQIDFSMNYTLLRQREVKQGDGACAHFKTNANILNLIHHTTDYDLEAAWTFTATGHGKGAGGGIGTVIKTIARRATLSKNILLSTAKDFFEFSKAQQLTLEERSNKDCPGVYVFYIEAEEVEKAKNNFLKARSEKFRKSGKKNHLLKIANDSSDLGTIRGIRMMHEFQPTSDTTVQYRTTSRSTHIRTFTFK